MGTDISSKRPFSNPDVILEADSIGSVVVMISAELLSSVHVGGPSLILMMIERNLIDVIIGK